MKSHKLPGQGRPACGTITLMAHDEMIGTAEAAAICGVPGRTFWGWVATGKLAPATRLSPRGPMLFRRSDIEKYAAARRQKAAS